MEFNLTYSKGTLSANPPVETRWGDKIEPLQANNNVSYLQFIDIIKLLLNKSHPNIVFTPYADNNIYDSDYGYIVYSLVEKIPVSNNPKPRIIDERDLDNGDRLMLFIQSFLNHVKFTAIHKNPRTAEELLDAFEYMMLEAAPILTSIGVQGLMYGKRPSDENKIRYGENVSARSVIYLVTTQMILTTTATRLEEILIQIQAPKVNLAISDYQNATPNQGIYVNIYDNMATPSTHTV